ncbi:MAG: MogA/MoaB family molybdenum cofactor biosynthesis protein [Elusimicrobia bacterium]|nr:MogA/MoaB family molybdenum cofactor biosynthesis protein [Elusimicrobiota bacterium]
MTLAAGILTVSDRCSRGEMRDDSGPALQSLIKSKGWSVARSGIVPDDRQAIERRLREWIDSEGIAVVLTTGGTGIGPRDLTPEVTRGLLDKELPGFGERMRLAGCEKTNLAALSRGLAGTRGRSLIINLPGNPRGAVDSLKAVLELVPHALAMLQGEGHPEAEHR